jgi:uncharacterized protein (TIRG00374 family)
VTSADETGAGLSPRQLRALIWSIGLAALGYLAISLWGGWQQVAAAASKVGIAGLVIALLLSLVNYGLRFIRWQYYLRTLGHGVPWVASLHIYLLGFALTTTPGKAGEMLRSVFLKRYQMPYAKSIAAFFSERLSDLMSVLLLTLFGLVTYPAGLPVFYVLAIAVFLALVVLHSQRWLDAIRRFSDTRLRGGVARVASSALDIVLHSRQLYGWAPLGAGLLIGFIAWAAEAWAFHLMVGWMGLELPWPVTFFIYAFSMIVGAISFLPGGLGSAELTMVTLLTLNRVEAPEAVALTVLIRVTTLWFAVLLGVVALLRHHHPDQHP